MNCIDKWKLGDKIKVMGYSYLRFTTIWALKGQSHEKVGEIRA
jgi:hypothetical protein